MVAMVSFVGQRAAVFTGQGGISLGRDAQRLLLVLAEVVHVEVPVRFDRETPTSGSALSVFGQFIGNMGCFNPNRTPTRADRRAPRVARPCGFPRVKRGDGR
jgi:hypothetical protein